MSEKEKEEATRDVGIPAVRRGLSGWMLVGWTAGAMVVTKVVVMAALLAGSTVASWDVLWVAS